MNQTILKNKNNIGIVVTYRCNQNCSYCFEVNKNQDISSDVINNIRNQVDNTNKNIIYIWGGEPFLVIDRCNEIADKFDKCKLFISTNGTIFNKDIQDFLIKNKNRLTLQISLDGVPNGERPLEQKTIDNLLKFKNIIDFNIQATITPNRIDTLIEDFIFLKQYSYKIRHKLLDDASIYSENDLQKFLNKWSELQKLYNKKEYYLQLFHYTIKDIKSYFCSAGINEITYNVDGTIYPCLTSANQKIHALHNNNDLNSWKSRIKLKSMDEIYCSYADCFFCPINRKNDIDKKYSNFARKFIEINERN